MDFNKTLAKLLGNDKKFNEVQIDQRVIDEIIDIARQADPEEYVALLSGKVEKKILKIKGLIFLPFQASSTSAVMQVFMLPLSTDAVGSVHSHPGPSNMPSDADLQFFGKNGYFHMIIAQPYNEYTIGSYDPSGNPVPYRVVDMGEDVEIRKLEDFEFEDYFDEEFIEEMKKDEQQLLDDEQEDEVTSNSQMSDIDKVIEDLQMANKKVSDEISSINQNFIDSSENSINELEYSNSNTNNINNENIIDNNITMDVNNMQQQQHVVELELEVNGELITKKVPLPPEYEPGDDLEVSIRTDKTPGDEIDEITINVMKPGQQQIESTTDASGIIDVDAQKPVDEVDAKPKTSKELEDEIRLSKDIGIVSNGIK